MVNFQSLSRSISTRALAVLLISIGISGARGEIRCGAANVDISPRQFPAIQNGGFLEALIERNVDSLHARAIVFDDGADALAIVVVDSCMIPRDLCDQAKELARAQTGIATSRMLISATHTHAAPSVMDFCLGSRKDPAYTEFLPGKIAEAIVKAHSKLQPARIGFAVADAGEFTKNRRWIRRSDKMVDDPFGEQTVQAMMHPGHQNPDFVGPSGPIDPDLSLLNVQTIDGKPLALLANFSMHYFSGHPGASADYYGRFAKAMQGRLAPGEDDFVAMMSQGTSGDLWWGDYSLPTRQTWGILAYTNRLATLAESALKGIAYDSKGDIDMAEERATFSRRLPDTKRLAWAGQKLKEMGSNRPRNQPEVYAEQARWISQNPMEELVVQAIRIGDIAITGLPNEVYAITGLKLKARSPHSHTFNMSLANGAAGYIPPPEQHALGGYTTWPARTAGLEERAEPKMVTMLERMLRSLTADGKGRAIDPGLFDLNALPSEQRIAYFDLAELELPHSTGPADPETLRSADGRLAFAVPGIKSPLAEDGRALGFAGGSYALSLPPVATPFSIELWIWNGLPNNVRDITGYVYSFQKHVLGISGTAATDPGRLFFANELGRTEVIPRAWNHLVVTSDAGNNVCVYLNGNPEPEIRARRAHAGPGMLSLGSDGDDTANFEGRIDEVTIFSKVFTAEQVVERFKAFGIAPPSKPEWGESRQPEPAQPAPEPKVTQIENQPLSAAETIAATHVAEGFVLELVAAEPEVADPVALDWGPDGKLWVAEMADYPYGMDGQGKPGGRVRYLQDNDGDGRYESSTLFVDGLHFPTSVMAWRDGVLITAAPDLLFANDPDGDGIAQVKVLFSGFVQGNQQLRVNSLRWGLDNWVYCASGGHHVGFGKDTVIVNAAGESVVLGSRDFRFNPDTGELDPQSGPSQFGRVRDDFGNWFGVQNSWPLWHYVLPDHYLRRNPSFAAPDPRVQVRTPGNPRVFPNKAIQKRFHSYEQAGRYTSACGPSIYRDDLLFPGESIGMTAFTCEPFHNVVQRHSIRRDGLSFKGERAADGELDFFASGDRWCRPVMSRTGPDGALYIVDMYRYMIEHPDWLPPNGREELKPFYRAGEERGRIYRIRKKAAPLRVPPLLANASGEDRIAALAHPNGIVRDQAHRLIVESGLDPMNVGMVINMIDDHADPRARLHALCVLDGVDQLPLGVLGDATRDPAPEVRRHAARLAEARDSPAWSGAALVADADASVRLQAILSLGEISGGAAARALVAAARDPQNAGPHFQAAIMSSAPRHLADLATGLPELPAWMAKPLFALAWSGGSMVPLLSGINGDTVRGMELASDYFTVLDELGNGKKESEDTEEFERFADQIFHDLQKKALETVTDVSAPTAKRLPAIRLLGRGMPPELDNDLRILRRVLIAVSEPMELRRTALERLFSIQNQLGGVRDILTLWSDLDSALRVTLLELALRQKSATLELLNHANSGAIPPVTIPRERRQQLLSSSDMEIRAMAEQLFSSMANTDGAVVVSTLISQLKELTGNAAAGAEIFFARCAICHVPSDVNGGARLGPDLRSITDRSRAGLLAAIVDPSAAVDPSYVGVTMELGGGESLYGLIRSETGAGYTIQLLDGTQRSISRDTVVDLSPAPVSLMPSGLESGLSPQQMADLLEYIRKL